jgi:hypothetical protein
MQRHRKDREFWESYAAETEAGLRKTEAALKEAQAKAEATPPQQLDLLAMLASQQAEKIELDEATTRILIDDQLRAAGWTVDSQVLRHANGTRPKLGEAIAIAEWPTESGPADYALFIEGRCVGVIEAKRGVKDVPGRLGQSKRYARDIKLTADETIPDSPWIHSLDQFRVPFLFVTNGRPYVSPESGFGMRGRAGVTRARSRNGSRPATSSNGSIRSPMMFANLPSVNWVSRACVPIRNRRLRRSSPRSRQDSKTSCWRWQRVQARPGLLSR